MSETVWDTAESAFKKNEEVAVLAKNSTSAGINVDLGGLSGFIPTSQIGKDALKNPEVLVGKYFKAKIIEIDRNKNKLVLSEREVSDAKDIKANKKALESITEGDIFEGVVTTIAGFGVFVKIKIDKAYVEGLVHISEVSWGKVSSPSEVLKEKDKVKVMVMGIKDGKLALSIKRASKDPWQDVSTKYKHEDKINGKVVKVSDFGVFVEIEPGVEGLIHITKIPPTKKLSYGDNVNCYVEEVDAKNKKISLGLVLTAVPLGYK